MGSWRILDRPSLIVHVTQKGKDLGPKGRRQWPHCHGQSVHLVAVLCCPIGAIPGGLSIGPPGKSSIDDSYGRYDLIQNSESPASPPVAVPHSWSRAKSDSDKISNGSSINWPPGKTPTPLLCDGRTAPAPSLGARLDMRRARICPMGSRHIKLTALAFPLGIHLPSQFGM